MGFLLFLSDIMIPLIIFYIVGFGLLMKRHIYEDFIDGAQSGLKTVVKIMPTLIGLMTGVGILRASGFLDMLGSFVGSFLSRVGFPGELVPLSIVKMFSSSAATGLLLDIYKKFGTDSRTGLIASLLLASTETIFYTMSIYFMTARVTKTRWTLPGALLCTLAGTIASTLLAGWMLPG
jgi:spore maturation protein B